MDWSKHNWEKEPEKVNKDNFCLPEKRKIKNKSKVEMYFMYGALFIFIILFIAMFLYGSAEPAPEQNRTITDSGMLDLFTMDDFLIKTQKIDNGDKVKISNDGKSKS